MKKGKDILWDVKEFIVLAVRANIGINGKEWGHDGCWPEGADQAFVFNCIVGICLSIFLIFYFDLPVATAGASMNDFPSGAGAGVLILFGFAIPALYSFIVVFFLFDAIKSYLGISFPLRGKKTRGKKTD